MIRAEECAVGILTWPCGHVRPESLLWLARDGVDLRRVHFLSRAPAARAVNDLAAALLDDGRPWILVVERDLVPQDMLPFWTAPGDVVGVWYPSATGRPEDTDRRWAPWPSGPAWHRGLWRAHRRVLEIVPAPWFPDRPRVGCRCRAFAEECRRRGLAVVTAGVADHAECPYALGRPGG